MHLFPITEDIKAELACAFITTIKNITAFFYELTIIPFWLENIPVTYQTL